MLNYPQPLDNVFQALADPTRRGMIARLSRGPASVSELAEPFDMSQPAISKHLKVLEGAGLIARRIDGSSRPCRLAKEGVEAVDQWLAMIRKALDANFERLDVLLAEMQPQSAKRRRRP